MGIADGKMGHGWSRHWQHSKDEKNKADKEGVLEIHVDSLSGFHFVQKAVRSPFRRKGPSIHNLQDSFETAVHLKQTFLGSVSRCSLGFEARGFLARVKITDVII